MSEETYLRLREFLDNMPGGYPSTPSGVEIRILKKLFAPEEADLCLKLKKDPEAASAIAARLGIETPPLAERLEDMARRGLIFRLRSRDGVSYKAYPFFVGIIDAQINRADLELARLVEEYFPFLGATGLTLETKQMRVIPAGTAVDTRSTVHTYNRMRDMVREEDLVAVAPCLCRQMAELKGKQCKHPYETCLSFGDHAQFYMDNGVARRIRKDELSKLLDLAEKSGLVINTSNTQDLSIVCMCCSCCCGLLNGMRLLPQTSLLVNVCYQARIDADLCSGCGICLDRCPIGSIQKVEDILEVNPEKCIGCGLCVSACPEEAIVFLEMPNAAPPFPDHRELMIRVSRERGLI